MPAHVFAFHHQEVFGPLSAISGRLCSWQPRQCFDFADGAMARRLHVYSLLGKELDSLSDLISFGLAPALLTFNTVENFTVGGPWYALCSMVIVLSVPASCAALISMTVRQHIFRYSDSGQCYFLDRFCGMESCQYVSLGIAPTALILISVPPR